MDVPALGEFDCVTDEIGEALVESSWIGAYFCRQRAGLDHFKVERLFLSAGYFHSHKG